SVLARAALGRGEPAPERVALLLQLWSRRRVHVIEHLAWVATGRAEQRVTHASGYGFTLGVDPGEKFIINHLTVAQQGEEPSERIALAPGFNLVRAAIARLVVRGG